MEAIADALVYAVSYINCRPLEDHESRYDDGDVGALDRHRRVPGERHPGRAGRPRRRGRAGVSGGAGVPAVAA